MENSDITLELNYTVKDFRPFLFRKLKGTIVRTALFVFIALLAVYIAASGYVTSDLPESFRVVAAAFLFAAPMFTVGINLFELERVAMARAKRGPVTLTINGAGITSREEYRTAIFEWPAYRKGYEDKDKFVLLSHDGGLLVPKRCFDTEEEMFRFREIVVEALEGAFESK